MLYLFHCPRQPSARARLDAITVKKSFSELDGPSDDLVLTKTAIDSAIIWAENCAPPSDGETAREVRSNLAKCPETAKTIKFDSVICTFEANAQIHCMNCASQGHPELIF